VSLKKLERNINALIKQYKEEDANAPTIPKYRVLRFKKGIHSYRFYNHDTFPESKKFNSIEEWMIDCLKEGYQIDLIEEL
jgi:hypothetical protein